MKPGDTIYCAERSETWVAGAVNEAEGWVIPLGWPCQREPIAMCAVTESCSDDESLLVIEQMAAIRVYDPRKIWAVRELERRGLAVQP
ncbi:MAG TPA: hypothetical protein VKU87_08910 [Thermomicrobiaceae bacterium]|nr:hypothetical protein [Thermomicrobiaceae bacterium]